nr:hypothetical protein [uncultured Flavobacterium sp.]
MSGFKSIGEVVDSELSGRVRDYIWRKTPSQTTTIGIWFDLSMSPGMPTPKYWFDAAPLIAKGIYQSADGGFYHGPNVTPSEKFLRSITTQAQSTSTTNATPMNAILLDYLLYYPSIDDGTLDEQVMDNTVTLPRYTDGKGIQMMAVTTGVRTGGQTFQVKYTNQDGVTGRLSSICTQNAAAFIGSITNSDRAIQNSANWMIPLAAGDTGVRAVESVTMISGTDVGLFSIILVKPLAQTCFREGGISTAGTIATPYEKDFLIPTTDIIRIYDDAFLNFVVLPQASLATTVLRGDLKVIWT